MKPLYNDFDNSSDVFIQIVWQNKAIDLTFITEKRERILFSCFFSVWLK